MYEKWNIFVTQLFGIWCQHSPTYILTEIYSYLRWQMCFFWLTSLCSFSLLRYEMVFFNWGNWLSYSWGGVSWRKLIIIFLCIWLRKTYGSIIEDLFWLKNTDELLEILIGIKIVMPDIINCDIWIITCRLGNNWQGFSSVDKNYEASYQFWSIKKQKWLKTVIQ